MSPGPHPGNQDSAQYPCGARRKAPGTCGSDTRSGTQDRMGPCVELGAGPQAPVPGLSDVVPKLGACDPDAVARTLCEATELRLEIRVA